ncbi:FAD/NAD(P)-binding domain-containing protein [Xylariaceae sp. FL0594]|nr:FAD/NAD(P)-binding domain-containing protein [Xylariaceae sp. FL0594]
MSSPSKAGRAFRVIVVGGGVGGLTLANMFERFGIDYVVLEAYKEILPQKGAGVLLAPNGAFIMDQLGCFDKIRTAAQNPDIESTYIRDHTGKLLTDVRQLPYHQEKRYGYPQLFFDRRVFLDVLYDQVKCKDRILTSKRIDRIDLLPDSVKVVTDQGEAFSGDIVIGAGGIHSAVRREMRHHAEIPSPGLFDPAEEEKVPCYYMCSYGIAVGVEGWPKSSQGFTTGKNAAFLVSSGPGGRVYWFLFVKLPEVKYRRDIPTYTTEGLAAFVQKHAHLQITEHVRFGQIFAKRIPDSCGLTPIHEVVFKRWFFSRMFLLGDSVHKPSPLGGMGANAAVETAAELLNAMLNLKAQRPSHTLDGLTNSEIESVFQTVQDKRFDRAKHVVSLSHDLQALLAERTFYRNSDIRYTGATRLKYLPLPTRPRLLPYDRELPAKPVRKWLRFLIRALCVLLVGFVRYSANKSMKMDTLDWNFLSYSWSSILRGFTETRMALRFYALYHLACMLFQGVGRATLTYALLTVLHSPQATVDRTIPVEAAQSLPVARLFGLAIPAICLVFSIPGSNSTSSSSVGARMKPSKTRREEDRHEEWYITADAPILVREYKLVSTILASAHIALLIHTLYVTTRGGGGFLPLLSLKGLLMPVNSLARNLGEQNGYAVLADEMLWMRAGTPCHGLYMLLELRHTGLPLGQVLFGPGAAWLSVYRWREDVLLSLSSPRS